MITDWVNLWLVNSNCTQLGSVRISKWILILDWKGSDDGLGLQDNYNKNTVRCNAFVYSYMKWYDLILCILSTWEQPFLNSLYYVVIEL